MGAPAQRELCGATEEQTPSSNRGLFASACGAARAGKQLGGLFLGLVAMAWLLPGCSDEPNEGSDAVFFPADFLDDYKLVRDCRLSIDHDLASIEVFAAPDSAATYDDEDYPFKEGSVIVKVEYADEGCDEVSGYTAMKRAADDQGEKGWYWQRLDAERQVKVINPKACSSCHNSCSERDFTCALP